MCKCCNKIYNKFVYHPILVELICTITPYLILVLMAHQSN
ncbi:MAG: hypothetical protein EOP34_04880 [Rickettsiales bacterium]|nr:MAG: hypothetical protein EOP34_04880 [Rickettsiales bacterium]